MHTRTRLSGRHALIAPDGHVPSQFPGWVDAIANVILSPAMGADLSQILITYSAENGTANFPADEHEHACYLETGTITAHLEDRSIDLVAGSFLFIPPHTEVTFQGSRQARLTVFRKVYQPHLDHPSPALTQGHIDEVKGEPFMGNERAILQTLLPIHPSFDLAINIFTYQPGATLPFVETHIMEHGLLMLSGDGIYRLEDDYYPVHAGDAIWMAPYCPQWFAAIGDVPASYLYYKDIHRLPE